jgi:UDP-N-acetylmuramate dehydrogenase
MTSASDNPAIERDVPLGPMTTFGIGGPARLLTRPQNAEQLAAAVRWAKQQGEPWFLLGLGANILVGDSGFDGLVIKNEARGASFDGPRLRTESGAVVADLIELALEKELSGIEHFVGIPSSLGGALWQNLHFLAPDRESTLYIGEIVESARLLSGGEVIEVDHDWFNFGYDYSTLHDTDDVVLSATLRLTPGTRAEIEAVIAANRQWRGRAHPPDAHKNSAGSIFRKIEGVGAGRLIDAAGLKGTRVGGAEISHHHANYIVNTGGATAADVRELIELVQQRVKADSGHLLTPEIGLVGDFQNATDW